MGDTSRSSRRRATARREPCLGMQRVVAVFATHCRRIAAFLTRNALSINRVNTFPSDSHSPADA